MKSPLCLSLALVFLALGASAHAGQVYYSFNGVTETYLVNSQNGVEEIEFVDASNNAYWIYSVDGSVSPALEETGGQVGKYASKHFDFSISCPSGAASIYKVNGVNVEYFPFSSKSSACTLITGAVRNQ
jgi:hypothetical protein